MSSIVGNARNKKCKAIDCDNTGSVEKNRVRYLIKGYCQKHYRKLRHNGGVNYATRRDPRPAIIEGDIAKIPLGVNAKGGYAIVDADMAWLADKHKWYLSDTGYAMTGLGRGKGRLRLHHAVVGKPTPKMHIDHINRNPLDNRRVNLREVTPSVNAANSKKPISNTSGIKNVRWDKLTRKWEVEIRRNGKKVFRNRYKKLEHAIIMRDIVKKLYDRELYNPNYLRQKLD